MSGLDTGERKVLVIFPGALGDLMLAMPAVGAIAARNPGASIELMARGELARLAEGRSVVTWGHSIDRREVTALFAESSEEESQARGFFGQFGRIYSFFAFDDARFRKALAASTDGAVSFHRFRPEGEGHIAAAYLRSVFDSEDRGESGEFSESDEWQDAGNLIAPNAGDIAEAKAVLESSGVEASKTVVIFPGSGSQTKNWPVGNFVKLAKRLSVEIDASPIIVLGPAEEGRSAVFRAAGLPVVTDLELGTVAAIARMASCFIGNDSGVSHLAASVGARGVVIFGPSEPARWRPLGRVEIVRGEPIASIEVGEVEAAVRRIWETS